MYLKLPSLNLPTPFFPFVIGGFSQAQPNSRCFLGKLPMSGDRIPTNHQHVLEIQPSLFLPPFW